MRRPRRYPALREARCIVIAAFELARARIDHARLPLAALLAEPPPPTCEAGQGAPDVAQIAWAIGAVARRVPFRADCVIQALAAQRWLRRRGLTARIHLGVARTGDGIAAHAWLTQDGRPVVGGDGADFVQLAASGGA